LPVQSYQANTAICNHIDARVQLRVELRVARSQHQNLSGPGITYLCKGVTSWVEQPAAAEGAITLSAIPQPLHRAFRSSQLSCGKFFSQRCTFDGQPKATSWTSDSTDAETALAMRRCSIGYRKTVYEVSCLVPKFFPLCSSYFLKKLYGCFLERGTRYDSSLWPEYHKNHVSGPLAFDKRSFSPFLIHNEASICSPISSRTIAAMGTGSSSCGRPFKPTKPKISCAHATRCTVFAPQEGFTYAKDSAAWRGTLLRWASQRKMVRSILM